MLRQFTYNNTVTTILLVDRRRQRWENMLENERTLSDQKIVLEYFLRHELPVGAVGGIRAIEPGDEFLLAPEEIGCLGGAVVSVRRASGAGRSLARELCRRLGVKTNSLPRSRRRFPIWPCGLVGSIAHDREFAAVVAAFKCDVRALGIDIEPSAPLHTEIERLIGSDAELTQFRDSKAGGTILFSLKEAVFKAVYPMDGMMLDFHDVTVYRDSSTALTNYGRVVRWRVLAEPRVLAVAWLE
jgi:4'-phosphopantetheinyl transferase EntD